MRICIKASLILLAIALMAQPLTAQVELEDTRTVEQKWTRSMVLMTWAWAGFAAHGKTVGQAPGEVGEWLGTWVGPSWGQPGNRTLASFVSGVFRNFNLWPGAQFEVLTESDTEITGRMNAPYAGFFGEDGEAWGVTLQEFQGVLFGANETIADYLGFDMNHEVSGEWVNFTVKTR
jgi:hypothetical protein